MKERVFLLRWTPGDAKGEREARGMAERLTRGGRFARVFDRRGALLLHSAASKTSLLLPDDMGAVFGVLFHRPDNVSVRVKGSDVSPALAFSWAESAGEELASAYWGNYLAVLHERGGDKVHVVRDPAGSWPVFWADLGAVVCIFTHAEDFIRARAGEVRLDEMGLRLFLAQSRLASARTAIEGVEEIMPGERVTLSRSASLVQTVWRPRAKSASFKFAEIGQAKSALREVLIDCAQAWRVSHGPVAHRLSGGLDSSVALAALCAGGKGGNEDIVSINERPKQIHEGDERIYARMASEHLRTRLIELEQAPEEVDYARLLAIACGARPALTELSFAHEGFAEAVASAGALVVTSGQGGDQVFQRGGAVYFAYDALREGLKFGAVLERASEAARVSGKSAWDALGHAMAARLGLADTRNIGAISANPYWGLAMEAAIAAENHRHPWAEDAARAFPARAFLIRRLADIAYYHRPARTESEWMQAPFLAAQPVLELVLRLPSYFQALGGQDRSLLRAAFAQDLPAPILARKSKGDTTRHFARIVENNLPMMRELLLDGELASNGLLARTRLEAALKPAQTRQSLCMSAVLNAFVAETWARRFAAAAKAPAEEDGPGDNPAQTVAEL